ncbi:MAG TPA: lipid-A-disaccharide synthase [Saprospiraceae bacterium]|nr:lipid-A-disaccharide synthase [Saprospiraceae bacterium]HND88226.1 lipid-A-disaccharide synthase [Saprospiraceae bacterium]
MRLYIIAGEASGDLHGSNLIRALRSLRPDLHCRVWGGDLMQAAGGELVKHYRDLAFMGFVEVLKNLRTILRNIAFCKRDMLDYQPDALVLIDYPGFNLRIARWAKARGIRVVYYISPQIWAWHQSRVHAIRRDVDQMLVILPFEQDFFRQHGMDVEFVGHPLLDAVDGAQEASSALGRDSGRLVALLPGSRRQEVERMLPVMLQVTRFFPDYRFVVVRASSLPAEYYQPFLRQYPQVALHSGSAYEVLCHAEAALVKSGTSTLETALMDVPQVVCYAGNPLSYSIAKRVVKVRYISLVNLILDEPLVEELIQHDLNVGRLRSALQHVLSPEGQAAVLEGYKKLRHRLGDGGASERAAQAILSAMQGLR